eukprot:SAG31_NODE_12406_length_944_cov_1.467456_1_plen_155_part_10
MDTAGIGRGFQLRHALAQRCDLRRVGSVVILDFLEEIGPVLCDVMHAYTAQGNERNPAARPRQNPTCQTQPYLFRAHTQSSAPSMARCFSASAATHFCSSASARPSISDRLALLETTACSWCGAFCPTLAMRLEAPLRGRWPRLGVRAATASVPM